MYGIQGIDDQEALRQLLGTSPMDYGAPQGFQPQQTQQLTQGLLGDTSGLQQEMQALADSDAGAQLAQWAQMGAGGGGRNRIAQQQAANQQALNNRGGGLLSTIANAAIGNWIGGMFKKRK